MPLDLPDSDAGLAFTGVWVARAVVPGGWEFGPVATAVVDGAEMGFAWSDELEALEQRPSEQHELFEMSVSDVLSALPPGVGLVVDPHVAAPRVVPAAERERVFRLGLPWAPGVPYLLHEVEDGEVDGFLTDLRGVLPDYPQLGRVWCLGYEVVGGPAVPMVVAEEYFVDLSSCTIAALEAGGGMARIELSLLEDVPAEARGWFDEHPPLNA